MTTMKEDFNAILSLRTPNYNHTMNIDNNDASYSYDDSDTIASIHNKHYVQCIMCRVLYIKFYKPIPQDTSCHHYPSTCCYDHKGVELAS